jgi:hypothetical protein
MRDMVRKTPDKVAAYELLHRSNEPRERPPPISVERTFDNFVEKFGGTKISDILESKWKLPLNADYFFKDHNIIAELKTFEGVFSGPEAIRTLSQACVDAGCSASDLAGYVYWGEALPERASNLVLRRFRRAIEQRIKKARKQLRQSKSQFGNKDTQSLILIAIDQPPLFGHDIMLNTIAKLMGDNYSDEHTDGVIYMNPNAPTQPRADGMEFSGWFPFYRDDEVNKRLSGFVNLLGNRWLTYYAEQIGEVHPILELDSFKDIFAVLGGR